MKDLLSTLHTANTRLRPNDRSELRIVSPIGEDGKPVSGSTEECVLRAIERDGISWPTVKAHSRFLGKGNLISIMTIPFPNGEVPTDYWPEVILL